VEVAVRDRHFEVAGNHQCTSVARVSVTVKQNSHVMNGKKIGKLQSHHIYLSVHYLPGVSIVLSKCRVGDVKWSQTVCAEEGPSPTTVGAVLRENTVLDVAGHSAHVATRKEHRASLRACNDNKGKGKH